MLNKPKFGSNSPDSLQHHAQFRKPKYDQAGWTAGVFLRAQVNGERVWLQRIMANGNRLEIQLGKFPELSLNEARVVAEDNRRIIAAGGNVYRKNRQQNQQYIRDRIKDLSRKTHKQLATPTEEFIKAESSSEPLKPIALIKVAKLTPIETARALGPNIDAALTIILDKVPNGENSDYVPQDILTLHNACGIKMLEWACQAALDKDDCTLLSIVTLLDEETDTPTQDPESTSSTNTHNNIRGAEHFH
jgi:hypothetical protein